MLRDVVESMGDLLVLGRQAEREARRDRNGLAVAVNKRSAGTRSWRASWSTDPAGALEKAIALLQDRLPSGKVYEMAAALAHLPEPGLAHDLVLGSAFVPRPIHVSGWDVAGGAPKATCRMVAPGAVYFFERADGKPFAQPDAEALWLAAMCGRTEEGFGRVVAGVWSP